MRRIRLFIGIIVISAVVCALPLLAQTARTVTVEARAGVPEHIRALFEEAAGTALPLMDSHLGLGLKGTVVRHVLFPDKAGLLEGYQSLLGYTREQAEGLLWSTGRAIRHRSGNYVFTRLDGFGRAGPDRVVAVRHAAHELTHVVQGAVKLCPSAVPSWMTEGWAEWAGFRVVDLAGLRPYDQQRSDRIDVMRRAWERTLFPPLVDLNRREWERHVQARGSAATYGVALIAVERLIERAGTHTSLDTYCTSVRTNGRWAGFEQTFGISEPNYALEFIKFIGELMGP